jgi:nitrogen fixation/metabolism regulation signal transduction histidine kinase
MKDFYDVYILLNNNELNETVVKEAIAATFERRNHTFVKNPEIFTDFYCKNVQRQTMWNSFIRKNKLEKLNFTEVVKAITEKLQPIYFKLFEKDNV